MALAANSVRTLRDGSRQAFRIVNAAEMYAGAVAALNSRGHGTAASRGRLAPYNDANFLQPVGLQLDRKTGDTAAAPIVEGSIHTGGFIAMGVSVAGSASEADVMRLVYMTDDDTFTLVRPTLGIPIGFVSRWIVGTTCDVNVWSFAEFVQNAMAGQGQYTWTLGTWTGVAAAGGNVATGIECPHHGFITAVYGIVSQPLAAAGASLTYNLEIDGVDVTGGVVAVVLADVAGAKKAGSAVAALNEFHEGSLLDVEVAVVAASTAGLVTLFAEVQPEPGA